MGIVELSDLTAGKGPASALLPCRVLECSLPYSLPLLAREKSSPELTGPWGNVPRVVNTQQRVHLLCGGGEGCMGMREAAVRGPERTATVPCGKAG